MNNRILRVNDVMAVTGLPRSTIYAYRASGNFPRQVKLGPRAVGWLERDIQQWIDQRSSVQQ